MQTRKNTRMVHRLALPIAALFTLGLSGCGTLASNGIDYSSYPIPALPAPPAPAAPPPPPPPPLCVMPEPGQKLSLAGCQLGDVVVLRGVNFEFDRAVLTQNARTLLDEVVAALKQREDIKVEIDGHTDGVGSGPYNLKLSDERAAAVKEYLTAAGIAGDRLTPKGFGKTMPVADNATDEGREKNRRVELKIVESAPLPPPAAAPVATPTPAINHSAVVVLEPIPSFLQEPGAGLPTSIGVLTTVPKPIEAGPSEVTSKRMLPPNYSGSQPALKGYPGSSYSSSSAPAVPSAAPPLSPAPAVVASSPSPAEVPAAGGSVIISNFMFAPAELVVAAGSTVTWTNRDSVIHTIVFSDGDKKLATGQSYSRAFTQPGEYVYRCGIHPSMAGKIIVK